MVCWMRVKIFLIKRKLKRVNILHLMKISSNTFKNFRIPLLGSNFDETSRWLLAYRKKQENIPESCSCDSLNPQLYGNTVATNKNETFKHIGKIRLKFSVEEKETIKVKKIKIKGLPDFLMSSGLYFRSEK